MSRKILFVDDEPEILATFERMFRTEFEIETAVGGEAGLLSIRDRGPFGVVVSDIEMPGMDGIQFLSRVRQVAPDSARILTGRAEVKTVINAINEGRVFEFLTKPCSKDILAKAINGALAERDRRRAPRANIQLPIRLFRSCTGEKSQLAHTLDISASGARLAGLKEPLNRGEVIDIQCGKRKAPFQVAWMGSPGTATAEQAGVECLAPEGNIWELNLLQPLSEEPLLREITLARTVQSRLFPQEKPTLQTLDYSGHCIPARVVGGDYYDFLDRRPGEVGFVVADIAGKGVAAALLMANLQGVLRSNLSISSRDIPQGLAAVNHHFHKHTNNHDYATLFFGCYSDATRKLRYVNCGHNPPLLLRQSGTVEKLGATATVLGLFHDWDCSVAETELGVGDLLTVYTDGLTEATNQKGEEFGEPRFLEILRGSPDREADTMVRNVEHAVEEFVAGDPGDDVTLLIARAR